MEPIEIREFRTRIGKAIRKLRYEEKITAKFLADVLQVTQPTISRIENGLTSIPAEKLCYLAKVYNRSIADFIGEQSSIHYSEIDVIRAGLVFYGAKYLKIKRSIDVNKHYKTYEDLLADALNYVDDQRILDAIIGSIYVQAKKDNLRALRVIASIRNEAVAHNLAGIVKSILDSEKNIDALNSEKKRIQRVLRLLFDELVKEFQIDLEKIELPKIDSTSISEIVNEK